MGGRFRIPPVAQRVFAMTGVSVGLTLRLAGTK
jgi:hypothetical protein